MGLRLQSHNRPWPKAALRVAEANEIRFMGALNVG